jgi:hypothetical protein
MKHDNLKECRVCLSTFLRALKYRRLVTNAVFQGTVIG